MNVIITADRLYTPLEQIEWPVVFVTDGVITGVQSREERELPTGAKVVELGGAVLVPGYLDMHIHGGAGHDVMEANEGALPAVEQFLLRHGVTSYLPTTI